MAAISHRTSAHGHNMFVVSVLLVALVSMHHGAGRVVAARDHDGASAKILPGNNVSAVTFVVSVNTTWATCIASVRSPPLAPNMNVKEAPRLQVGACDDGPLTYRVSDDGRLDLTFYSSVVEDASPPTCSFQLGLGVPSSPGSVQGILPSCYTMDSREGYHMTSYWFTAVEWH